MTCFNLLWTVQGLCFVRTAENNGFCISVIARETFLSFLYWVCEVRFATQVPQNCLQAASIRTCYSAPEPHPLPFWPGHLQGCFLCAFSHFSQSCSVFFLFSQRCLQASQPLTPVGRPFCERLGLRGPHLTLAAPFRRCLVKLAPISS